ncbi:MAG: single-stranded DNA-binding protein [Candidatus Dormibacteraeota bacterium]|nr:single-stranded DNA-binding protein [Candidatus Dormibacteraeota bacterium]
MSRTVNKVILIGRLGKDPEMKYTSAGQAVTTFTLATNRYSKGADGTSQELTDWHTLVAWDKLAETCAQFLTKGRLIYIEGRLQTRSWDGPDGQKHSKTEVVLGEMQMLDSRPPEPAAVGVATHEPGGADDPDLPF